MSPSTRSVALSGWRKIPGPPPDPVKARLLRLHRSLARRHGELTPRTPESGYAAAAVAVLRHDAGWTDAAGAVDALQRRRFLDPGRLLAVSEAELTAILTGVGTSCAGAHRLRAFTAWLVARFAGRFRELELAPLAPLRAEMVAVRELGRDAADAILLYAAHRPVFVADVAARRALARHGFIRPGTGYEAARRFVEAHLPSDPALLGDLHALLVTPP